jgi:hypothetical protein
LTSRHILQNLAHGKLLANSNLQFSGPFGAALQTLGIDAGLALLIGAQSTV